MSNANHTCEICWCVVLDKYQKNHEERHEFIGDVPEGYRWSW